MEGTLVVYLKCTSCSELFNTENNFFDHCKSSHCEEVLVFEHSMSNSQLSPDETLETNGQQRNLQKIIANVKHMPTVDVKEETNDSSGGDIPLGNVEKASCVVSKNDRQEIAAHVYEEETEESLYEHTKKDLDDMSSHLVLSYGEDVESPSELFESHSMSLQPSDSPLDSNITMQEPNSPVESSTLESESISFETDAIMLQSPEISLASSDFARLSNSEGAELKISDLADSESLTVLQKNLNKKPQHKMVYEEQSVKPKRVYAGQCPICNKFYKRLDVHIPHTHEKVRPYVCEICGRRCGMKSNLRDHMRTHSKEKPYSCDLCGMKFKQVGHRTKHRITHFDERPFLCNTCGKTFRDKADLRKHSTIHTAIPLKCNVCGLMLKTNASLNIHMKTHDQEKDYKCPECDKAFVQKCNLITHLRVHTGEKPFTCDICNKSFRRSQSLKHHCQAQHSNTSVQLQYTYIKQTE